MMHLLYYFLVIAGCIALASLLTALLSWRGRESKLTYTLVFTMLCYLFITSACQFLFFENKQPTPWQAWQNLYHQLKDKDHKKAHPGQCKAKTTHATPPVKQH